MNITIVARASHQRSCAEAVASGVRALGGTAWLQESMSCDTKLVCCWGWRRGKELRAKGHEVLVMERAYLGDRFAWYSLGWNGLNGRAEFRNIRDDGGARFKKNFTMKPWRKTPGRYVLLTGQVPGDASLQGKDLTQWYTIAAVTARATYGMPVLFREHPEAVKRGIKRNPAYTEPCRAATLDEALADAHLVVTYNSNSAVDAVMAGVPAIVGDWAGSMARPIASWQLTERRTPEREDWAYKMAWKQWSLTEIARGVPFHA